MDYDATSLYPSAKWDVNLKSPKTDFGYAFTTEMNDEFFLQKIIVIILIKVVLF